MGRFGTWASREPAGVLAARFAAAAPTVGPVAARASCEVSAALGGQIGLPVAAIAALDDVHERWDGLGIPAGLTDKGLDALRQYAQTPARFTPLKSEPPQGQTADASRARGRMAPWPRCAFQSCWPVCR